MLGLLCNYCVTESVMLLSCFTLTKDSCSPLSPGYTTGDLRFWSGTSSVMYSTSAAGLTWVMWSQHPLKGQTSSRMMWEELTKDRVSFGDKSLISQSPVFLEIFASDSLIIISAYLQPDRPFYVWLFSISRSIFPSEWGFYFLGNFNHLHMWLLTLLTIAPLERD